MYEAIRSCIMTVVFSSLSTMGALDLEEVKDAFSRQEAAYRVLEDSASQFVSHADREKEALLNKISQLEILLKSRQGALVAKERECEKLRQLASVKSCSLGLSCNVGRVMLEAQENLRQAKTASVWLSTCVGIGRTTEDRNRPILTTRTFPVFTRVASDDVFFETVVRSPPATVFRREHVRSPRDSSLSPRRIIPPSSLRRNTRESFASIRSSRTIKSLDDTSSCSSDESLNELVSNAMRLSAASFRSSTSSLSRVSVDSSRASFPKRWK